MTKDELAREPGHTVPVSFFIHRDEWGWERLYAQVGNEIAEIPSLAPYTTQRSLATRVAETFNTQAVHDHLGRELGRLATRVGRHE